MLLMVIIALIYMLLHCHRMPSDIVVIAGSGDDELEPKYEKLTEDEILLVSALSQPADATLQANVEQIAVERVPGSLGSYKVQEYIRSHFLDDDDRWLFSNYSYSQDVPVKGMTEFSTLVFEEKAASEATEEDDVDFLVLSAHFDSKWFPPEEGRHFIGATDSAVPCAMLLDIKDTVELFLSQEEKEKEKEEDDSTVKRRRHRHRQQPEKQRRHFLKFIFFDGEEAFGPEWTRADSLYGSRHLASTYRREDKLQSIGLFVLLDIIGDKDIIFHVTDSSTFSHFEELADIEERLVKLHYLHRSVSRRAYFSKTRTAFSAFVDDDHRPFKELKVPTLHLIALPFPSVWHKDADNVDFIDFKSTQDIACILKIFAIQYIRQSHRPSEQARTNLRLRKRKKSRILHRKKVKVTIPHVHNHNEL